MLVLERRRNPRPLGRGGCQMMMGQHEGLVFHSISPLTPVQKERFLQTL